TIEDPPMTLKSYAQEFFAFDNNDYRNKATPGPQLPAHDTSFVSDKHEEHGEHGHNLEHLMFGGSPLEVSEPLEIEIVVEELPGAPAGTKDPEPMLEVSEEPIHAEEKDDANDAKKGKDGGKGEKWDWSKHGPHGFVAWIKGRIADVPKHSGYDTAGLERAIAYMERVDNEISKAMRMDLDGELDGNKIEVVRSELDDGIARLQSRLDKVKDTKKSNKRKKKSEYVMDEDGFIKEAQKITGVKGVYVTVPLLI